MPRPKEANSTYSIAEKWGCSQSTVRKWKAAGVDVTDEHAVAKHILRITERDRLVYPSEREAAQFWDLDLSFIIRLNRHCGIDVSNPAEVRAFLMAERFGW